MKKRKTITEKRSAIRSLFRNRYFLAFFNGFLVATLIYTEIESRSEAEVFRNIVHRINDENSLSFPKDSFIVKAMHVSHFLLASNLPVFKDAKFSNFESSVIYPATFDLMTTNGMCGSFSRVLARTLQTNNIEVRFAQMEVQGTYGGHIILEARSDHGWIVLDPMYDLSFKRPDGRLASFEDVHNNWTFYRQQLPEGYNPIYRYEGVQYTNWNKIPLLLPALKMVLDVFIGKHRANEISIRTYFLRPYHVVFLITLLIFVPVFIFSSRRLWRIPALRFYSVRKMEMQS